VERPAADDALVARVRAGDEAAFDALFRDEFPKLVRFGVVLLQSVALAEEASAEVFLRIWRARETWEPRGPVRAYLFRAVRNQAANTRRGETRSLALRSSADDVVPGMGMPEVGADDRVERAEVERALWSAIDALPEARRAVAYLRWREGMEYDEIATITGQQALAVKKQLNRIVIALRDVLGGTIL
jgi:RNA polymerase sigma-70 factor (ECF subfamily)